MLTTLRQRCRNLLLNTLMVLSILGVQVLQVSPLHDHSQHTVECTLCHFHLGDDSVIERGSLPPPTQSASAQATPYHFVLRTSAFPAYQVRGPPSVFA